MPGQDWQWCAVVVRKTGSWLPEGRDPWLKEATPRTAARRAGAASRYEAEYLTDRSPELVANFSRTEDP